MLNQVTIIGRVTEVLQDRDATVVVVKTAGGTKRDGGEWEELAACRFWDKAKKWTEGVARGQLVKVDGSIKSRKGEKGWFTGCEARYLQKLTAAPGANQAAEQQRDTSGAKEAADDADSIPF